MEHSGDLRVTKDNLDYAATLTEISGYVYISAEGAQFPVLTSVGGSVDISAEGAQFPVLTSVGGYVDISAEGAQFPVLTSVGGYEIVSPEEQRANLAIVAQHALANDSALDMSTWHSCTTTHCIAGWAAHAIPRGREIEDGDEDKTVIAGHVLLGTEAASYFFSTDEKARALNDATTSRTDCSGLCDRVRPDLLRAGLAERGLAMIVVRDGFPSDMADLLMIESQAFHTPCDSRDFRAFFQSGGLCLLAVSGSLPSGYLMYRCLPDRRELWSMGVLCDSQRMGIGSALINHLKQRVRQSPGLQTIDTWVSASNHRALRFLRTVGFHEVRRETDVFDAGLAVLMRWPAQCVQKLDSAAELSLED